MDRIWLDEIIDDRDEQIVNDLLESSDDDSEPKRHGGSLPGRAPNIDRGREAGAIQLHNDYFATYPVYVKHFLRRFRISPSVFHRIVERLEVHDPYFTQRKDCIGRLGFTAVQKATAALRILAYGCAADQVDEYVRIGESTASKSLENVCEGVVHCFGDEYLRCPTADDLRKQLAQSAQRGFPGMLGSIDNAKWKWKNCPTALKGQYEGKEGTPAVTLECIADERLWIWHLFFGMPGCANDINVLNASPLQNKIIDGTYPPAIEYEIGGVKRDKPYWLADGIYPRWPCFVQTVSHPTTRKEQLMASSQEAVRKDAERAFGVLQARWHIVARPSRFWYLRTMRNVMKCCVLLHDMMVEDRELDMDEQIELLDTPANVVGAGGGLMWASSLADDGQAPPPGSIAAACAFANFTRDEEEYFKTRQLVTAAASFLGRRQRPRSSAGRSRGLCPRRAKALGEGNEEIHFMHSDHYRLTSRRSYHSCYLHLSRPPPVVFLSVHGRA